MSKLNSKLNNYINYPKLKKVDEKDKNKEVSVFKVNLTSDEITVIIALGEIKTEHIKHNIVYCPVYLVLGDGINNKISFKPIGVYEFFKASEDNLKDKEGDLDIRLIDGPLLYKDINGKKLKQILNNKPLLKDISEREEADIKAELEKAVQDQDYGLMTVLKEELEGMKDKTGEKQAISAKPLLISLEIEDDDDVDYKDTHTNTEYHKIVKDYEQMENAPKKNWLQKKFHDYNYEILTNKGAGDCFFIALKQAYYSINKKTTEKKLRDKLATNIPEKTFQEYKSRRDMFIGFIKKNQKEQEDTSLKHSGLKKMKRDKQKKFDEIKKSIGQKSLKNHSQYKEIVQITEKQVEVVKHFHALHKEAEESKEHLQEFAFMDNIKTLKEFKNKIKTSDYWADDSTLRIIEEVLNIKIIVIDKENRKGLVSCLDATDTIKAKGWFKPKYYVIMDLFKKHYQLVTYKNRKMFRFHELPYSIKDEIKHTCLLGSDSGVYNYIPKFNNLIKVVTDDKEDDTEHEVAIQDAKAEASDNEEFTDYDKNIVFIFNSKSSHKKPGKGTGEKIPKEEEDEFKELDKEKHWRKVLSNFWVVVNPFELDGQIWNSVEHYYQASKFKNYTEGSDKHEFYLKFTADSNSEISKDPVKAKLYGGTDEKANYRPKHIFADQDFLNGKHKTYMERGQRAKYTTDIYSQKILLLTKNAKLVHLMKNHGHPSVMITFYDSMKIRKELNNK